jgi:hypothetical protein
VDLVTTTTQFFPFNLLRIPGHILAFIPPKEKNLLSLSVPTFARDGTRVEPKQAETESNSRKGGGGKIGSLFMYSNKRSAARLAAFWTGEHMVAGLPSNADGFSITTSPSIVQVQFKNPK